MVDPDDIRGWQRLDAEVTTSGRIEDKDVMRLADLGVVHVVNLALETHPEALAAEGDKLAAQGIAYTHIPVPFDAPDEDHFSAFVKAVENGPKPVHVHCIMNWRVSAFFYRYNRDHRGLAETEARKLMERQWSPEGHDSKEARVWAEFIARTPG